MPTNKIKRKLTQRRLEKLHTKDSRLGKQDPKEVVKAAKDLANQYYKNQKRVEDAIATLRKIALSTNQESVKRVNAFLIELRDTKDPLRRVSRIAQFENQFKEIHQAATLIAEIGKGIEQAPLPETTRNKVNFLVDPSNHKNVTLLSVKHLVQAFITIETAKQKANGDTYLLQKEKNAQKEIQIAHSRLETFPNHLSRIQSLTETNTQTDEDYAILSNIASALTKPDWYVAIESYQFSPRKLEKSKLSTPFRAYQSKRNEVIEQLDQAFLSMPAQNEKQSWLDLQAQIAWLKQERNIEHAVIDPLVKMRDACLFILNNLTSLKKLSGSSNEDKRLKAELQKELEQQLNKLQDALNQHANELEHKGLLTAFNAWKTSNAANPLLRKQLFENFYKSVEPARNMYSLFLKLISGIQGASLSSKSELSATLKENVDLLATNLELTQLSEEKKALDKTNPEELVELEESEDNIFSSLPGKEHSPEEETSTFYQEVEDLLATIDAQLEPKGKEPIRSEPESTKETVDLMASTTEKGKEKLSNAPPVSSYEKEDSIAGDVHYDMEEERTENDYPNSEDENEINPFLETGGPSSRPAAVDNLNDPQLDAELEKLIEEEKLEQTLRELDELPAAIEELPNTLSEERINRTLNKKDLPIVIVGGGPTGAAAALGAARKGYDVVLINKYPYAVRTQRVKVNPEEAKLLKDYMDPNDTKDQVFLKKLKNNAYTVSVGAIERFWERKIYANRNIRYINDATVTKLTDVNLNDTTVTLTSQRDGREEIIPFQHLIDASGASRSAFRLAAGEGAQRDDIEEPISSHPHLAQGTAIFNLNDDYHVKYPHLKRTTTDAISPRTIFLPKFNKENMQVLREKFGWDEIYTPSIYIISNAARSKFYVGGEIPTTLLHDKAKVQEWFSYLLSYRFNVRQEDLHIADQTVEEKAEKVAKYRHVHGDRAERAVESKSKLRTTTFELSLSALKEPVKDVSLTQDGSQVMVALGDALQLPNFHSAHGMNDGLKSVKTFLHYLPEKNSPASFQTAPFQRFVTKLRDKHQLRMDNLQKRYQKKKAKYAAYAPIANPFPGFTRFGKKIGGANSAGKVGGVYIDADRQKHLMKQDSHKGTVRTAKVMGEAIAGDFLHDLLGNLGADLNQVAKVGLVSIAGQEADKTGEHVYLKSTYIRHYKHDLWQQAYEKYFEKAYLEKLNTALDAHATEKVKANVKDFLAKTYVAQIARYEVAQLKADKAADKEASASIQAKIVTTKQLLFHLLESRPEQFILEQGANQLAVHLAEAKAASMKRPSAVLNFEARKIVTDYILSNPTLVAEFANYSAARLLLSDFGVHNGNYGITVDPNTGEEHLACLDYGASFGNLKAELNPFSRFGTGTSFYKNHFLEYGDKLIRSEKMGEAFIATGNISNAALAERARTTCASLTTYYDIGALKKFCQRLGMKPSTYKNLTTVEAALPLIERYITERLISRKHSLKLQGYGILLGHCVEKNGALNQAKFESVLAAHPEIKTVNLSKISLPKTVRVALAPFKAVAEQTNQPAPNASNLLKSIREFKEKAATLFYSFDKPAEKKQTLEKEKQFLQEQLETVSEVKESELYQTCKNLLDAIDKKYLGEEPAQKKAAYHNQEITFLPKQPNKIVDVVIAEALHSRAIHFPLNEGGSRLVQASNVKFTDPKHDEIRVNYSRITPTKTSLFSNKPPIDFVTAQYIEGDNYICKIISPAKVTKQIPKEKLRETARELVDNFLNASPKRDEVMRLEGYWEDKNLLKEVINYCHAHNIPCNNLVNNYKPSRADIKKLQAQESKESNKNFMSSMRDLELSPADQTVLERNTNTKGFVKS